MERVIQDISWSNNMKRAYRLACHDRAKKRLDKAFERNMRIKQVIWGVVVCLVADAIGLWLAENGCEPILLETAIFNVLGIHLITTDILYEKVLRDETKEMLD